MLVAACEFTEVLLKVTTCFNSQKQFLGSDGWMWCLIYLERESPTALVGLLKEKSFEVHIAPDLDNLLDALWYHGSAVGCIVIETSDGSTLDELMQALEDWPDLKVLISGQTDRSTGQATHQHRFVPDYSLQNVSHWLGESHRGSLDGAAPSG